MRPIRSFLMLLVMTAVTAACGGASPSTSEGAGTSDGSQPSVGASASTGGGGGGGGGANGSLTYRISGSYTASGELPFIALGGSTWIDSYGGWVATFAQTNGEGAYIQLNTQTTGTGQIFTYGDPGNLVVGTSDPSTGSGCTFTLTQNDPNGLKGTMDCTNAGWTNTTNEATGFVQVHAEWDGHP